MIDVRGRAVKISSQLYSDGDGTLLLTTASQQKTVFKKSSYVKQLPMDLGPQQS